MAKCHRMESYMSDYKNVLKKCADMGIDLWTENGKLKYKASTNTLSQDILRELKKYKEQIIEYLEKENQDCFKSNRSRI